MFGRLSWCASAKRRGSAWAEARCSLDFSLGSHKRERARELARESRPRPVSPPAGHAHRAHCGTTRFLILSRLAEGGHFRELCLPPPPPPPGCNVLFRVRPEILSLWRLLAAVERRTWNPPSKMSTVFTQATSPLKLNLHAPKPASRFDDLSFDPMDASPLPARGLAAAGCVQAMPPRRSTPLRPRSSRLRLSPPKPHFTAAAALRPGAAQK